MWSEVWGNAAEWVGGVGTAIAAVFAAAFYVADKLQQARSQATLVYVVKSANKFTVHNRSDKPIVDVKVVPKVQSLWAAARSGDYHEMVLFGGPTIASFPSHEFYNNARYVHGLMKQQGSRYITKVIAPEIKAGGSKSGDINLVIVGGLQFFVYFRDAHGRDWSLGIESKKLRAPSASRHLAKKLSARLWAAQWIIKNEIIFYWRINDIIQRADRKSHSAETGYRFELIWLIAEEGWSSRKPIDTNGVLPVGERRAYWQGRVAGGPASNVAARSCLKTSASTATASMVAALNTDTAPLGEGGR